MACCTKRRLVNLTVPLNLHPSCLPLRPANLHPAPLCPAHLHPARTACLPHCIPAIFTPRCPSRSAAVAALDAAVAIALGTKPVPFSREALLDCVRGSLNLNFASDNGCGGGYVQDALTYLEYFTLPLVRRDYFLPIARAMSADA